MLAVVPRTGRNYAKRGQIEITIVRRCPRVTGDSILAHLLRGATIPLGPHEHLTLTPNTRFLRPSEAAARLGVSYSTLMRLVEEGRLRAYDISQGDRPTYRFHPDDLERYLQARYPRVG